MEACLFSKVFVHLSPEMGTKISNTMFTIFYSVKSRYKEITTTIILGLHVNMSQICLGASKFVALDININMSCRRLLCESIKVFPVCIQKCIERQNETNFL